MALLAVAADTAVPDISDPSFAVNSLPLLADAGAAIEQGPFIGAPVATNSDFRVEIVNLDATYSHIDWVTLSSQRSILRPLAEPGSHSITVQNDSPQAAMIDVNTALRYHYKGRPAVVGICEPQDSTLIALDKDLVTQWSGRLVEAFVLGAMQVYPAVSTGRKPIQQNRNLDYTEPAYDDSAWAAVNVIGGVETARFLYWYLSAFVRFFAETPADVAKNYPDPFAALLSAPGATLLRGRPLPLDSGGDHYVRQWVPIDNDGSYDGYLLGDDAIELAIDGVPVGQAGTGFMAQGTFQVDLTAGLHLFAMHINNHTDAQVAWALNPGGAFNPGFGAWSLFRSGFTGTEGFVAHSDGTAKILPFAPRVPGMTYGRAIRLLVDEAAARGCTAPTLGFTDAADSAGVPWQYGVVSTRVMNDVHSTLKEQSVANIDFSFRSGGFVLDAWAFGGKGSLSAVPFAAKVGANPATMSALTKKGGGPVTNSLLESTAYGWDSLDRPSSISTYGRQEAGYSLGAANSQIDAQTIANGRLDIVSVPRYQYEAIHDTVDPDAWAFNGFDIGDRVPFTPPGAGTTLERVVSIKIAEGDDTGRTVETVSLRDVVYYASPIEHFVGLLGQWAKKMIPGTGRGSWPETQPVTPPGEPSRLVRWVTAPPPTCEDGTWAPITSTPAANIVGAAQSSSTGEVYLVSTASPGRLDSYSPLGGGYTTGLDPLPFNVAATGLGLFATGPGIGQLWAVYSDGTTGYTASYGVLGDTWGALLAPMPTPRSQAAYANPAVNKVNVIGGFGGGASAVHEQYDTNADTWATKAALDQPSYGGTAASYQGDIFYWGSDAGFSFNIARRWNHLTDTWSSRAAPPWPVGTPVIANPVLLDDAATIAFLVGGGTDFWLYMPADDSYHATGSSANASYNAAANASGKVFAFTFGAAGVAEAFTC